MREALDSPLPVSGLTMHVFAAPFKGTAPNASVLLGVEMRGRDLQLGRPTSFELAVSSPSTRRARLKGGKPDTRDAQPQPETKARIEQTGLRMLSRFDLPPGRYQLRVGAHDCRPAARRIGAATTSTCRLPKAPFA